MVGGPARIGLRRRHAMTPWSMRPLEQRTLLNPGFCSMLLWHAAIGHEDGTGRPGPDAAWSSRSSCCRLSCIARPANCSRQRRPRRWLSGLNTTRSRVPGLRSAPLMLVPLTSRVFLRRPARVPPVSRRACGCRARLEEEGPKGSEGHNGRSRDPDSKTEFVGRWLGRAGSAATVIMLLGVRR